MTIKKYVKNEKKGKVVFATGKNMSIQPKKFNSLIGQVNDEQISEIIAIGDNESSTAYEGIFREKYSYEEMTFEPVTKIQNEEIQQKKQESAEEKLMKLMKENSEANRNNSFEEFVTQSTVSIPSIPSVSSVPNTSPIKPISSVPPVSPVPSTSSVNPASSIPYVPSVEQGTQSVQTPSVTCEDIERILGEKSQNILAEISALQKYMTALEAKVSSLRKLADLHQDIENNLNNQINEYKDNLYRRIVNPILIEFFDIQEEMITEIRSNELDEKTAGILNGFVNAMSNVFTHYGVEVDEVNIGDKYDSRIHKPIKSVPTDNKELDKTIAKVKKILVYSIDGKVVERARVHVYQYNATKSSNE